MVVLVRLPSITPANLTMATTTKAKEDDDHDKQMTSTIPLPPQTTTTTTTTTTTATTTPKPPTSPRKLKDLPPPVQDRQSSGGDESIVSSLSSTSSSPTEQSTSTLFLPFPNPSASKSRSSFVLPDNEFPPEMGNADIFVASESTFSLLRIVHHQHATLELDKRSLDLRARFPAQRRETTRVVPWASCPAVSATCTDPGSSGSGCVGYKFLSHTVPEAFQPVDLYCLFPTRMITDSERLIS